MSTKTIEEKLNMMDRELVMLRSALMATIAQKDPEGEYRPEFVRRILGIAKKKGKKIPFTGVEDFLRRIN